MARPPPLYQFAPTPPIATPGAMNMAYESEYLAFRPLIGPGIGARYQFRTLAATPDAYQAAAVMWQTGLTGVVHGQNVLQPLSNPYEAT